MRVRGIDLLGTPVDGDHGIARNGDKAHAARTGIDAREHDDVASATGIALAGIATQDEDVERVGSRVYRSELLFKLLPFGIVLDAHGRAQHAEPYGEDGHEDDNERKQAPAADADVLQRLVLLFLHTAKLLATCRLTTRRLHGLRSRVPGGGLHELGRGRPCNSGHNGLGSTARRAYRSGSRISAGRPRLAFALLARRRLEMRTPGGSTLVAERRFIGTWPRTLALDIRHDQSAFRKTFQFRARKITARHNQFVSVTVLYEKLWVPRLFSNILYIRHAPYTRRAPNLHHASPSPHMVCLPSLYG